MFICFICKFYKLCCLKKKFYKRKTIFSFLLKFLIFFCLVLWSVGLIIINGVYSTWKPRYAAPLRQALRSFVAREPHNVLVVVCDDENKCNDATRNMVDCAFQSVPAGVSNLTPNTTYAKPNLRAFASTPFLTMTVLGSISDANDDEILYHKPVSGGNVYLVAKAITQTTTSNFLKTIFLPFSLKQFSFIQLCRSTGII